jgi:hypothetical protein
MCKQSEDLRQQARRAKRLAETVWDFDVSEPLWTGWTPGSNAFISLCIFETSIARTAGVRCSGPHLATVNLR